MHKHQAKTLEELVPSVLSMLKEHIRPGHAGIVDHSVQFTGTRLKKNTKEEWKYTIHFLKLYKCIISYISAIWQQAAHTTYQLSSPSCSTRAKRKSLTVNKKIFESFLVKGPLAEELQDKNNKRTKQKKQELGKREQLTALKF